MRSSRKTALATMLGVGMLVGVSSAGTLSVSIDTAACIAGQVRGVEVSRIVLQMPVPTGVLEGRIDLVKLEMPALEVSDTNAIITLEAYQTTTAWVPQSVSWDYPWRQPGGDFDTMCLSRFMTAAGDSHPVALDITECVRSWQTTGNNYGMLLKRPDSEGGGFGPEGPQVRQAMNAARVKFYYTPIQR